MDPDSLNPDTDTDPDPAYQVNPEPPVAIRIQGFDNQKQKKKNTEEKKIQQKIYLSFLIKSCNLLIPRPPQKDV